MALVSIGMPVYNGERYVARALESLLTQTFDDLEVIICDNASTDATGRLCRRYARGDRRIRYRRHATNIGAGRNFNQTFRLSTGRYFKWAAHDDYCAPEYVARCVQVMEQDAGVVLCSSNIVWVDEHDRFLRRVDYPRGKIGSPRPHERFALMSSTGHGCFDVFGLMRRDVLARTALIDSFIGSDRALLAHVSLLGRLHRIDEDLFFSRDHPARSIRALPLRERTAWWDPALTGKAVFPWWRLVGAYARIIAGAPLGSVERLRCYLRLLIFCRYSWRYLGGELGLLPAAAVPGGARAAASEPGSSPRGGRER